MSKIQQYVGKVIKIEVAGGRYHSGRLIDFGPDIIVIFDSVNHYYYYFPLVHIKGFQPHTQGDAAGGENFPKTPVDNKTGFLLLKDVLEKAKDILLELYVTGNRPVYGYITEVMNDYLLFNSPVYKTMAIKTNYVKWLALTEKNQTFYSKGRNDLEIQHTLNAVTAQTFAQQLKKLTGNIVVFDMGTEPNKIGLVVDIGDYIELIDAREERHLLNINHIKTFHI